MPGSTRFTAARQVQANAAPASGQRPRVPVAVGDRPLSAAEVARILTKRAVLAWAECARHETRSSPAPSP